MKKYLFILSFIMGISFFSNAFAQPTEESLLNAWEALQKNDPKTVIFEKIGDKHYKLKTEIFPFEGELKVANLVLDKQFGEFEYSSNQGVNTQGIVEVELVGLPEDFIQKHAYSYSLWQRNNILYYNEKEKKWLPASQAFKTYEGYKPSTGVFCRLSGMGSTLIFLVIFLVLVFFFIRGPQKQIKDINAQNKKYMDDAAARTQKALDLTEETQKLVRENNQTLKEILEILKKYSNRS